MDFCKPSLHFTQALLTILSASTATIVRIVYIKSLTETTDYSWEGINLVKWSMVEPAIAITAMNIATLRPMFKNFFFFARKRFDSNIDDDEEATRPSADSTLKLRRNTIQNSVSAKEYSVEFAEMLGLSRVGVTTEISAGGSMPERDHFKKRFSTAKRMKFGNEKVRYDSESQTELNYVTSPGKSPADGAESFDWSSGIKATTVITTDHR